MMNLFLSPMSQTLADYFIVMQVDQAGWHRSKELLVPANIPLLVSLSSQVQQRYAIDDPDTTQVQQ
jgi:hypothetical protein